MQKFTWAIENIFPVAIPWVTKSYLCFQKFASRSILNMQLLPQGLTKVAMTDMIYSGILFVCSNSANARMDLQTENLQKNEESCFAGL